MSYLKKWGSKLTATLTIALALVLCSSESFAQATAAPTFTDVTDAVDIMAPVTAFTTYMATNIAVLVGIALAIVGVMLFFRKLRSMGGG